MNYSDEVLDQEELEQLSDDFIHFIEFVQRYEIFTANDIMSLVYCYLIYNKNVSAA